MPRDEQEVVEKMIDAHCDADKDYEPSTIGMSAALHVARESLVEEMLGEPTIGEWANLPRNNFQTKEDCENVTAFDWCRLLISNRRARFTQPKERVTIHPPRKPDDDQTYWVAVDGAWQKPRFAELKDAERYAAGLREELRNGEGR